MRSGFFNSIENDRLYDASFFAEYFATFIGNGVFPNPSTNLQVISNNDMSATIMPGKAWINGYVVFNDDSHILHLDVADGVLSRIDRIVLQFNVVERKIKPVVKKGSPSESPVAPELIRDANLHELALAEISVERGSISISQADITDLRHNDDLCGIVTGVVEQVDTTTLFNQYQSWYRQTTEQAEVDIEDIKNQFMTDFNSWYASNTNIWTNEFLSWFESIRGQLEGDVGTKLSQQVIDLQNEKVDKVPGKSLSTNDYSNIEKQKVQGTKDTLESHLTKKATQNTLGHIKLSDIPKPYVTDDVTGEQYKWGLENGIIYLEKVVR